MVQKDIPNQNNDANQEESKLINNTMDNLMISFDHAQKLVEFADSKANILLIVHTIVITAATAIYSLLITKMQLPLNGFAIAGLFVTIVFIFYATQSLLDALNVIYPQDADDDDSIFYYKTISNLGKDKYYKKIKDLTLESLEKGLVHQSFNISKIAVSKMEKIRNSSDRVKYYLLALFVSIILLLFGVLY